MHRLLVRHATLVWLVLMLAAGLSWYVGANENPGRIGLVTHTTMIVVLVAFLKVRLVIRHFMEVDRAPLPLRLICDGWIVATCCTVLGIYLIGTV